MFAVGEIFCEIVRWAHKRRKEDKEAKDFYKWAKKAKIVISGHLLNRAKLIFGPTGFELVKTFVRRPLSSQGIYCRLD